MADSEPADLEWQFNPRCSVPDFEAFMQARADACARILQREPDVILEAYGPDPRAFYLVVPAAANGRKPALVYIHGGYWRSGAPQDNAVLIPVLKSLGAIPIFLGYPLCPTTPLQHVVEAVKTGLAHIRTNASRFGVDPKRIVIAGTSAGAHLTAMAMATDDRSNPIARSALLLTGIYDLTPVPLISVNTDIGLAPNDVAPLSPMRLPLPIGRSLCFAVGGREPSMWRAQTHAYANLCCAAGCATAVHVIEGRHHLDVYEEIMAGGATLNRALAAQIEVAGRSA